MIYLASPYTHISSFVRAARAADAAQATAYLIRAGLLVFSPIVYTHVLADTGILSWMYPVWQPVDQPFLEWCDSMIVLKLAGWQESIGIQHEIESMQKRGNPIVHLSLFEIRSLGPEYLKALVEKDFADQQVRIVL